MSFLASFSLEHVHSLSLSLTRLVIFEEHNLPFFFFFNRMLRTLHLTFWLTMCLKEGWYILMSSQAEPYDHSVTPCVMVLRPDMSLLYAPIPSWESSLPSRRFNETIDHLSSHLREICEHTSVGLFLKFPKHQIIIPWSLVHLFS